ncbi:MAG TPA: ABC transporter ATP-binding protein [Pseudogracilibacillus sp.]|nr:ABC transporter ATP-binding protein [Pseudogracilibacillus sp.]
MQTEQRKGMKPFIQLILSTNIPKLMLTVGLIGTFISTIVSLTIPFFTGKIVDSFAAASIQPIMLVVIITAFLLQAVIDGFSTYLLGAVGQQVVRNLREKLWEKIIGLPVPYFDQHPSGTIVSRVVNDTSVVKDLISQHFPRFINGIISIIGAVIILFIMDWKMTLIMFISVPLTIACMIPLGRKMAKVSRSLQDETATFTATIQQAMSENRLMKASTAENVERKNGFLGIKQLLHFGLKEVRIMAVIAPLMYLIVMLVVVIIIGYGGVRVAEGTMSTGALVAFLLYLFQIIFPITSFAMFFTQLQKAQGATERIIAILEETEEKSTGKTDFSIVNKALIVEDLSFSYDKQTAILNELSFDVQPGQLVAFVGPSGAGKTTIFNLLEGFYQPTSGTIFIGDEKVDDIALSTWRKQIGYVSQESAMIVGTIRDNLTYGLENADDITDEALWKVAEMAYADQFIREFEKEFDTEVGERGVKLSGGQRQRINIARAFLRDPAILMLDEATASLDSQSEHIVQKALTRLMEGRTTLVIAHRLSTITNAHKIIFLENGSITGEGTHEQLVATHPLYRKFAEQQLSE